MDDLKAVPLEQPWYPAYRDFVGKHRQSMLYHTLQYRALLADLLGAEDHYLLAVDPAQRVRGILPLLAKDGPLGKVYNSLPYYGSNGAILADGPEAFAFLLARYNAVAGAEDTAAATLVSNPLLADDDYAGLARTATDYRIGQFTSLAYDDDHQAQLMSSFHYKTRNMVRKAQKEGVSIEQAENWVSASLSESMRGDSQPMIRTCPAQKQAPASSRKSP